jgi:SPP1 family predicted phage head-tail adaptor
MGMRAGTLRKRIAIQSRGTSVDSFGQQTTTWSTVATIWASIEPSGGKELMMAQAMNIDQASTITIRWQSLFADPKAVAAMRIVYGSRIFNIHSSANQEERNRVLVLIASEGLNDG